jgi:aspartate racemase
VALFGTRFTIESDFFGALGDVEVVRPSPEETDYIHRTYIEIVNAGRGPMSQETGLRNLANTLCRRDNVEAIVLAGTELNLIFNNGNTDFPTIDSSAVISSSGV